MKNLHRTSLQNFAASVLIVAFAMFSYCASAQDNKTPKQKKKRNIFGTLMNAISKSAPDTVAIKKGLKTSNSQVPYFPYRGKIIRNIYVKRFGFEISFTDTTRRIVYFGTKLLNELHADTKEWQIRNELFIKENTPLNPYMVAENERYLRSRNYIQDARIIVDPIRGNADSVDVTVVTKDLFSISGEINDFSPGKIKAMVGDANVMGMGQRLQFTGLYEKRRHPKFAYQGLYSKDNIDNSFVTATVAYTKINNNLSGAANDEHGYYLRLDRPLYSQFAHFAGGLIVGTNQSNNDYLKPDSFFYKYRYNIFDGWVGYNLRGHKFLGNTKLKDHQFISIRYLNNHFTKVPFQIGDTFNQLYNDKQAFLGSITFFRQDFYKTNYIYGFGTTEDVPYGYNVALTAGWYKQLNLSRAYAGLDANRYIVNSNGDFYQYFIRAGGYFHEKKIEDAGLLLGVSVFSRLFQFNSLKLRQYVRLNYTRQFDRTTFDPLKINNPFGLRYFYYDSVYGTRRVSLHSETFFFLKYKLFGFQFATFSFADVSLLTPENRGLTKSNFYSGLGGGVRARNENLIFGTMELRAIYFPRHPGPVNPFNITFTANLLFRYNTNYVRPPDVLQLNADYANNIY